jgi:hypothetical protein
MMDAATFYGKVAKGAAKSRKAGGAASGGYMLQEQAFKDSWDEAYAMGILGDGAHYGETKYFANQFARLMSDTAKKDLKASRFGKLFQRGEKARKSFMEGAKYTYAWGDDFWKLMVFQDEQRKMAKHYPELSKAAQKEMAARNTVQRMPTYSRTPNLVSVLRAQPFFGAFPSFPAEMVRNTKNIVRMSAQDFASGKRALAVQRMAGLLTISAVPSGFVAGMMAKDKATGRLPEDYNVMSFEEHAEMIEKSMLLVPEYNRFSTRPTWRTGPKSFAYVATDATDPLQIFKAPLLASLSQEGFGGDHTAVVAEAAKAAIEPIVGLDLGMKVIVDTYQNVNKSTGRKITTAPTAMGRAQQQMQHMLNEFKPTTWRSAERLYYAATGKTRGRKSYDLGHEIMANMAGLRIVDIEVDEATEIASRQWKAEYDDWMMTLKRKARNADSAGLAGVSEEARAEWEVLKSKLKLLYESSGYWGMDTDERIGVMTSTKPYGQSASGYPLYGAGISKSRLEEALFDQPSTFISEAILNARSK